MVKHVEPNRLSGLQVGKGGISGGAGKGVVCSKHLGKANKKEGMHDGGQINTVLQTSTHNTRDAVN